PGAAGGRAGRRSDKKTTGRRRSGPRPVVRDNCVSVGLPLARVVDTAETAAAVPIVFAILIFLAAAALVFACAGDGADGHVAAQTAAAILVLAAALARPVAFGQRLRRA